MCNKHHVCERSCVRSSCVSARMRAGAHAQTHTRAGVWMFKCVGAGKRERRRRRGEGGGLEVQNRVASFSTCCAKGQWGGPSLMSREAEKSKPGRAGHQRRNEFR